MLTNDVCLTMKSTFLKIYTAILCWALLIALISYLTVDVVNKRRYETYITASIGGTFSLIAAGIERHRGEKRQQWIDALEKITGLGFNLSTFSQRQGFNQHNFAQGSQSLFVQSNMQLKSADITIAVANDTFVSTRIYDINHALTRISALLVLNELGRHPKPHREAALYQLNEQFNHSLALLEPQQMSLDPAQWRQLNRGDIVTTLANTSTSDPSIQVYAPFGNSGRFLKIGPIPVFQWYPISLILPFVFVATLSLLALAFLHVHTLAKKLNTLEHGIKKAATNEAQPIIIKGNDGFTKMATSINDMILRIDHLVSQQRQLTNDISHELRTPIAKMMFRIENVLHHNPALSPDLIGIQQDLNSLNAMTDEMLSYARLDYTQNIDSHTFNLAIYTATIFSDLRQQYPSITFVLKVPSSCSVYGDKTLLLRAIENLVLNACRHCREKVLFAASFNTDGAILLKVEDDGPGIAKANRERVFDPFIRIDTSRQSSAGGFGLGLSIVKRIVLLHKGQITLTKSLQLGGAAFTVSIPSASTLENTT